MATFLIPPGLSALDTLYFGRLVKQVRFWTVFFIIGLVISGLTAFPLESELALLEWLTASLDEQTFVRSWINTVYEGLRDTNAAYPFMAYGTDWLAFAHLVIAVAFFGAYRNPVRNRWIFQFGMIACAMVIPLALIAGEVRGIPMVWRIVDCSFGILGVLPLWYAHHLTLRMENLQSKSFNLIPQ